MNNKQKIKHRIKWKVILKILLFFVILFICGFYFVNLKTKNILIKGTNFITDNEVIMAIGFKNYPKLFERSKKELLEKIEEIPLVNSVNIHRTIFGTLKIEIDEATPLFYNKQNEKVVLDNKKEIDYNKLGLPILTNYVPEEYYNKLIERFKFVDSNVRGLISEMEYRPWKNENGVMIDETRFFLKMNDGNHVYVNLIHLDKLNNYIEIYSSLESKRGTLYLDSSSDKISFSEMQEGD